MVCVQKNYDALKGEKRHRKREVLLVLVAGARGGI